MTSDHTVTFYPVGNGDSSQILLANGRRLIFDFRHTGKAEGEEVPEIDLVKHLRGELQDAGADEIDVLALTHGDADHISGSTDFFELRHALKYQGANRIKVKELWVPAAMILEECSLDGRGDEVIIWRQEARHRLREGHGIRVFSRPDKLKSWFDGESFSIESRKHLISDAGTIVPGFDLNTDGVEFFCHSPFVKHVDDGDDLRNPCSLIFNVRFEVNGQTTDFLAVGDTEYEILQDIVETTEFHGRTDRLEWDLFNIPHHCSYKALGPEKGDRTTAPTPPVERLLNRARVGASIVCSSKPIDNDDNAYSQVQPPHVQAKNCYDKYLRERYGARVYVTMEEPDRLHPKPLVFSIGSGGVTRVAGSASAASSWVSREAPRAGKR